LYVTLRLQSGEELPFLVDTGSPMTVLDKSLEPQLGKCLGAETLLNFGKKYDASVYAAPKLYSGSTPLITDSNALTSDLIAKMLPHSGHPIMGILGMDCLQHYCIQLDFKARKMRFLDPNRMKPARLGQAFPLRLFSEGEGHPEWFHPLIHRCSLVGEEAADLLIDTGADCDGLLEPELFQRGVREQESRVPRDSTKEPNSTEVPRCVWSGLTYTDLWIRNEASSTDGKSGENSLGLRFLARHLVTFDFPHRTMYLKQTSRGPLVDEELMAAAQAAGNSAFKPARKLLRSGQLPGWSKEDRGTIKGAFRFRPNPDTVTFDAVKKGDSSIYHYRFTRASQDAPWQFQKAWRTDQNDHTIEEYPAP
jgi:hypothetical protein